MNKILLLTLVTLIIPTAIISQSESRYCKSPEGKNVDWYVLFLFPTKADPSGRLSYGYYDNSTKDIKYYSYDIDSFPPTKVTKYANSSSEDFNYFFWNDDMTCKDDEKTHSATDSRAHAKGSLIMDKEHAVFLLHSLPRFPTRMTTGEILAEMPNNTGSYGQHFFCVTTSAEEGYTIAKLLNYINVQINKSVQKDRVNKTPNEWIQKLITNKYNRSYPNSEITKIKSLKGVEFTVFSKSYRNKIIPFDTTLREYYYDDFYVRTWIKPSLAPSICDDYDILNVLTVNFDDTFIFTNTKEHSKWALSKNKNICCFADINHCASQKDRGGNIVCFENKALATIMRNIISSAEKCDDESSYSLKFLN